MARAAIQAYGISWAAVRCTMQVSHPIQKTSRRQQRSEWEGAITSNLDDHANYILCLIRHNREAIPTGIEMIISVLSSHASRSTASVTRSAVSSCHYDVSLLKSSQDSQRRGDSHLPPHSSKIYKSTLPFRPAHF